MNTKFILGLSLCFALNASAQVDNKTIFNSGQNTELRTKIPQSDLKKVMKFGSLNTANKTHAGGARWYNNAVNVDTVAGGNGLGVDLWLTSIWKDTSVNVAYTNGLFPVSQISLGHTFDPSSPVYNDAGINLGELYVDKMASYTLDSLVLFGNYTRTALNGTIADSVIITVSAGTGGSTVDPLFYNYFTGQLAYGYTSDTMAFLAPRMDSVSNELMKLGTAFPYYRFAFPLTAADTVGGPAQAFSVIIPGGLNVTAGTYPVVSMTYKYMGTTTLGDSIAKYSRFQPWIAQNIISPANVYYKGYYDQSNFMYKTNKYRSSPTSTSVGRSFPVFAYAATGSYDYLFSDWHVTCSSCFFLGKEDIATVKVGQIYPNPANTEINIPFNLKSAGNVSVFIKNVVGQLVHSENLGKMSEGYNRSNISVQNLANGVYLGTIVSNGSETSFKFVVNK